MKHRKLQIYRLFHLLSFLESRHGICYPPCIDVDCIGVALTILDIGLPNVLHTPDGYACQVHLDESFFYAALPAAVPLNNSSLKGNSLDLAHLEGDISRSGGEVAATVATAVALTLLIPFISGCLCQFLSLSLQPLIEGFLYATSHQLLELALDNFLI